jgi:hypothetical protein
MTPASLPIAPKSHYREPVMSERFTLDPGTRALLHDLGISVGRVPRQAQLPAGVFAHGAVKMTVEDYYRFWLRSAVPTCAPRPNASPPSSR